MNKKNVGKPRVLAFLHSLAALAATFSPVKFTGSNPVEALIFFFRLLLSNCLNWKIHCDDHSSLSSTTAVQIWIISSRVRIPLKPADFFQASSFQLLKLENSLRWSFFTFTYHRSSNMNYFIYFTSWKYIIVLYLQVLNHKILSFSKSQPGVLTYSSAWYSYKHLYKVYCYREKRVILIRGQCQTLISQIFSGAEAIDKNLPAFCLNVFQLPPSVPLLHMLLLCYLHPLFHVLSS